MKKYEVYKNIRKRAVLFGLPLSLFALMMCSILCSLIIIIFSFSLLMVISIPFCNAVLYVVLLNLERIKSYPIFGSQFPKQLSNKSKPIITYSTI